MSIAGLDQILKVSVPVLVALYPIAIVLVILLLLIALMIWALVSFGSYLYSLVVSMF